MRDKNIKLGIDFDNTIICYDEVFLNLAKDWKLIPEDYQGKKQVLRDFIRQLPNGEHHWQKMQGKVYGELLHQATLFPGFKDFIALCNADPSIEIYIISHKTERGHFSENNINLRRVAREWLQNEGFFNQNQPYIHPENIFFEATREDKIERIHSIHCTHFIDDLIEVFDSPLFPKHVERYLFQGKKSTSIKCFGTWKEIKNAFFI